LAEFTLFTLLQETRLKNWLILNEFENIAREHGYDKN